MVEKIGSADPLQFFKLRQFILYNPFSLRVESIYLHISAPSPIVSSGSVILLAATHDSQTVMSSYDQCMVSDKKLAGYLRSDTNHSTCEALACCDSVLSLSSTCQELM